MAKTWEYHKGIGESIPEIGSIRIKSMMTVGNWLKRILDTQQNATQPVVRCLTLRETPLKQPKNECATQ